jgi:hypothetical protein
MENFDKLKTKLIILIASIVLVALVVVAYFLDKSLEWGVPKISSCVLINLWVFFLTPSIRRAWLINKDKPMEEWFKMGFRYGVSKILPCTLFAPYFGVRYYFDD